MCNVYFACSDSYLVMEKILKAVEETGAEAVHPGTITCLPSFHLLSSPFYFRSIMIKIMQIVSHTVVIMAQLLCHNAFSSK